MAGKDKRVALGISFRDTTRDRCRVVGYPEVKIPEVVLSE